MKSTTLISRKTRRRQEAVIAALRGPSSGREFLLVGNEIQLGRGEDCDVILHDLNASRIHALIRNHDDIFTLVDLQSKNGTFVNRQRISEHTLKEDDQFQIGDSLFRFRWQELADASHKTATTATGQGFHVSLLASKKMAPLRQLRRPLQAWQRWYQKLNGSQRRLWLAVIIMGLLLLANLMRGTRHQTSSVSPTPSTTSSDAAATITPAAHTTAPSSSMADRSLARERYSQGMQAMNAADYKRAIRLFGEVSQLDPQHPAAAKKLAASQSALKQAIEQYYNSGLREFTKMYFDRAIQEWEKAAALSMDFAPQDYQLTVAKIAEAKAKLEQLR